MPSGIFGTLLVAFFAFQISSALIGAELFSSFPLSPKDQEQWERLLMYDTPGQSRSLIAAPKFFLAEAGRSNSNAELKAMLESLQAPSHPEDPDTHPACRFPARARWLKNRFPDQARHWPKVTCPALERWQTTHAYFGVSLVFSHYYPNNPTSLFGHTLLRLHKSPHDETSPLLDDAVNFAATAEDDNALAYAWKGLTGGYNGTFSLMPYYMKIQEYTHAERRDVWEYRLNLSAEEIEFLRDFLWEVGPHPIAYFYFDDNCSAIVYRVLAAMRPELPLKPATKPWVLPTATIRAVTQTRGLVVDIKYHPSSLGHFLSHYKQLNSQQKTLLKNLIDSGDIDKVQNLAKPQAAAILDAFLDFIDYEEKVAGHWSAGEHEDLRRKALAARAALQITTPAVAPEIPTDEAPHLGHGPTAIGLWAGQTAGGAAFVDLAYRPALHDAVAATRGFGRGLAIGFMNFEGRVIERQLLFKDVTFIKVLSLPQEPPLVASPAWRLVIRHQNPLPTVYFSSVQGGMGFNRAVLSGFDFFGLLELDAGIDRPHCGSYAGIGPRLGVRWTGSRYARFMLQWYGPLTSCAQMKPRINDQVDAQLSFSFSDAWESRLEWQRRSGYAEGRVGLLRYF